MSPTTSNTTAPGAGPHILIFPYPAQGHMLPLLDLTHQLSLHNLTLTVLTTPKNLPSLSSLLSSNPNIQTLVFPLPPHPLLPPGVENVQELGNAGNLPVIASSAKLFHPILHWFRSHPNPPVAIVSDFFLGWTHRLARELNIPRLAFFSSGAYMASVLDHCWTHLEAVKKMEVVEFADFPGAPSFKAEHLPTVYRRYRESDPDWEVIRDGFVANMESFGCIFNSFEGLEGGLLSFLKRRMGHERVYAVGPLSLLGPGVSHRTDPGLDSHGHVFDWLDRCPDGSVVYVCFGSQKVLNRAQMEALAAGLEKSMTRFVWVVKTGARRPLEEGYGAVPDGFEERVKGRGLVIKGWAPQVRLLGHRAVGGFLSHCGWNSVLEGIVAGVMILGWPMEADQFIDARLLVEDLGVGVRVCEGTDSVPDSDELGRVIAESMSDRVGEKRVKAKELEAKALGAIREGGSSLIDLERLVHDLYKLQDKKGVVVT